jgi:sulfhydrogenase subunit gamma (sulfur reductase)
MEKVIIKDSPYRLKRAKILRSKKMTDDVKFFEISLMNGESLNHEPGQFVMVSLLGIGEVPISICSSPTRRDSFEICVKEVGKVTTCIHRVEAGDEVGIRGPYGKGFPVKVIEGNDLLIIAGGLLFGHELEQWGKRADIYYECTVDHAGPDWAGNVGLITTLIPGVDIDPMRTFAAVVGPPVMYKFMIRELLAKEIPERQILLSLERHMKCGSGKCGRCQIQHLYCCQDGPVFTYEKTKNVSGAF